MKQVFIFLFLILQISAFSQNLKMNITHDDKLFLHFESRYGVQINFLDTLYIDDCMYDSKLWIFSYDTTNQLQWHTEYPSQFASGDIDMSDMKYHSQNSSKAFYIGSIFPDSTGWIPIVEINHQTGVISPTLELQTVNGVYMFHPKLDSYANGDWLVAGTYSNGDFYFGDTSVYHFVHNPPSGSFTYRGFVVNFDSTNQVQWANEITGDVYLNTAKVAPNGNTYITGSRFSKYTSTFGNKVIEGDSLLPPGYFNGYVGKVDTSGNVTLLKSILLNNADNFELQDIHFTDNSYYLTGRIRGTASFDSLNYKDINLNSNNNYTWFFIAKYDLATDSLLWVRHSSANSGPSLTTSEVDNDGNIYVGLRNYSVNSAWTLDSLQFYTGNYFVAKFDTIGQLSCIQKIEESSPIWTNSNYGIHDLEMNQQGEILGIKGDMSADFDMVTLFSITDCQYTGIDSFSYNSCFSSSKEENLALNINVFPNPVTDFVSIEIEDKNTHNASLKLFTIDGRQVLEKELTSNQAKINIEQFPPGIYLLQVITDESILTKKLIKH